MKHLITLVLCLSWSTLNAATISLSAFIDGSQEVPSVTTAGSGFASLLFDDSTNILNWHITFSGLTGSVTGMHFHGAAPAGSNAGVQVNIGNISGLGSPNSGNTILSAQQEIDLLNNQWYINIHTSAFGSGEIRGQVNVVPIPAAAWLFALGLAPLIGRIRKKSSS